MPALCASCGAQIIWCETKNGKPIPVDAEPDEAGNLLLTPRPNRPTLAEVKHHVPAQASLPIYDSDSLRPRYTSHFTTCPNANEHRKGT